MSNLMREKCKLCEEPVHLEVDPTSHTKVYYHQTRDQKLLENDTLVAAKESILHEWHLCYYHKKMYEGLFDLKYPLYRFGLENAKLKQSMERLRRMSKPIPMLKI